ncbi:MAG: hypothetical protein ABI398_08890 [Devosia sp.]
MQPFIFWNSPKDWVLSPTKDGVVFLAAAMFRIGRARYGEQWTGREAALTTLTPPAPLPTRWFEAKGEELVAARAVLTAFPEGVFVRPLEEWADFVVKPFAPPMLVKPLSPDEWALARERVQQILEILTTSEARWRDVVEATFALLKVGALETVLRPSTGGDYIPPSAALWNTDLKHVRTRFWNCEVALTNPFSQTEASQAESPPDGKFHKIFVTTKSLDAILAKVQNATLPAPAPETQSLPPPPRTTGRLAEYKRGIVEAVRKSPDGPPADWPQRDAYIRDVGYEKLRLPKDVAKSGYAAALREAAAQGIDHKWSRRRSKAQPTA